MNLKIVIQKDKLSEIRVTFPYNSIFVEKFLKVFKSENNVRSTLETNSKYSTFILLKRA